MRPQASALPSGKGKTPTKNGLEPWRVWLRWLGVVLCTTESTVQFLAKGVDLGCRLDPS